MLESGKAQNSTPFIHPSAHASFNHTYNDLFVYEILHCPFQQHDVQYGSQCKAVKQSLEDSHGKKLSDL